MWASSYSNRVEKERRGEIERTGETERTGVIVDEEEGFYASLVPTGNVVMCLVIAEEKEEEKEGPEGFCCCLLLLLHSPAEEAGERARKGEL